MIIISYIEALETNISSQLIFLLDSQNGYFHPVKLLYRLKVCQYLHIFL